MIRRFVGAAAGSYGRHEDCERMLANIRELIAGPPMGSLGDNDEPNETRKRAVVTDDVVNRILLNYQLMRKIDADRVEASRDKIAAYIGKLNIARQFDAHQLTMYGLAYLKEHHEGRDKRFSGC